MNGISFTREEEAGYTLFKQHCNSCHKEPIFIDNEFRSNGLPLIINAKGEYDLGRGRIVVFDSSTYYKFRVPSLRYLSYTAPYMHDGRFQTIDEVLDHYSNPNSFNRENLDPILVNGIPLNQNEKEAIKAFLNTLNDPTFVSNPLFKP